MTAPVSVPKIQKTNSREVDDLQLAVKKIANQLNESALAIDTLKNPSDDINGGLWAGLGTDSNFVLRTLEESKSFKSATMIFNSGLALSATNYRVISLYHRNGSNERLLGSFSTAASDIGTKVAFKIPITASGPDLSFVSGDSVVCIITGGGTKPALGQGSITLYWEKL